MKLFEIEENLEYFVLENGYEDFMHEVREFEKQVKEDYIKHSCDPKGQFE